MLTVRLVHVFVVSGVTAVHVQRANGGRGASVKPSKYNTCYVKTLDIIYVENKRKKEMKYKVEFTPGHFNKL